MAKNTDTRAGMMMMMIQAPSRNFVTAKTTATTAVSTAPTPLATIFSRQRGSCRSTEPRSWISAPGARCPIFHHLRVIPACESVKERNTPMA